MMEEQKIEGYMHLQSIYRLPQHRFRAIPRTPWVYWISERLRIIFEKMPGFGDLADVGQGMTTGKNERFLRYWWEVSLEDIGFGFGDAKTAQASKIRWFPYVKGGGDQKWYGHYDYLINWLNDGEEIKTTGRATIRNSHRYFKSGITWSSLSSKGFSARIMPSGFLFDDKGSSCGISSKLFPLGIAFLNSRIAQYFLNILNPTVSFQSGDISRLPFFDQIKNLNFDIEKAVANCIRSSYYSNTTYESTFDYVCSPYWSIKAFIHSK
jgi:hypothetical protein